MTAQEFHEAAREFWERVYGDRAPDRKASIDRLVSTDFGLACGEGVQWDESGQEGTMSVPGGCFFRVGSAYFQAPVREEEHDFGGSVGRCISVRRCDIDLAKDRLNPTPIGDREWVQVKCIVLEYGENAWRTEAELRRHLAAIS